MVVSDAKLQAFMTYKASKLSTMATIEANRLGDLKEARSTVFKYAIPVSVMNAVAGAFGSLLLHNFLMIIPVTFFVFVIYVLANNLDLQKLSERIDIMKLTSDS